LTALGFSACEAEAGSRSGSGPGLEPGLAVESAGNRDWWRGAGLNYDEPLSRFAFNLNLRHYIEGSSNFLSYERSELPAPELPDLSDALARDKETWTSRGFYSSRATKEKSTSSFWESGSVGPDR